MEEGSKNTQTLVNVVYGCPLGSGSLRDKGPKRVDRNGRPFYPTRCHSLEGYHVIPRILKVHGRVQLQNEIPPHCSPVLPHPTAKISKANKK